MSAVVGPPDEASDPSTPPERLAELAYERPELRPLIAVNPAAYEGLLEWLAALGDARVDAALRTRGTTREPATDVAAEPDPVAVVADPSAAAAVLAEIAYTHPELRAAVGRHPNAYPDLIAWIEEHADAPAGADRSAAAAVAPSVAPVVPAAPVVPIAGVTWWPAFLHLGAVKVAAIGAAAVLTLGVAVAPIAVPRLIASPGSTTVTSTAAASGSSRTAPSPTPTVAPAAAAPSYVPTVLILDASGSMVRKISAGGTRMEAARTAAKQLVDGFGPGAQVGLTVFGTSTGNRPEDQAAGCSDITRLIPVEPIDKAALDGAIDGIVQSGYTPIGPALLDAEAELGDAEKGLIVVVSDGVDTCSPPSSCDIAAQVHRDHPGFTIQTVGFAVDADEQAQEGLACVAQAGAGQYVDAGDATQLAARLRALTDPVSTAGSLSATGLDGLQIGMSMTDAKTVVSGFTIGKVIHRVQYVSCDRGTLAFVNDQLVAILPRKPLATAEGIKVGDPVAAAAAIYGQGTAGTDANGAFQTFPTGPGAPTVFVVHVSGDKIVTITICTCNAGSATPVAVTSAGPLTAVDVSQYSDQDFGGFSFDSPDHNIHCGSYNPSGDDDGQYFGCSINHYTFQNPPDVNDCEGLHSDGGGAAWGGGFEGGAASGSTKVIPLCRQGVEFGGEDHPVASLPYGASITDGAVTCTSSVIGMSCSDSVRKTGFTLSASRYSTY